MLNSDSMKMADNKPMQLPWVARSELLWKHRRLLVRATAIAFAVSLVIAFTLPKQYKSVARIMSPEQQGSGAMLLAALAGRAGGLGTFGTLAGDLLGGRSTADVLIELMKSSTVQGHIVDRFDLQHLYHSRYRVDAAKRLAHRTRITSDKKSGVITLEVQDASPTRARDMASAYLEELNQLMIQTNTSAARQERMFIEQRLHSVRQELEKAQLDLSDFSSKNSTVDIKEQTRAMVDAGARVEGELLVARAGLQSLRQIYGDGNVRVKEAEARIASLQHELENMAGSATAPVSESGDTTETNSAHEASASVLYPQLRQLPRLAVPYADLYRRVRVQETIYELLTQQYELVRIEEAKDIPVVSVIDSPGVPEKKSFPPRLLLTVLLTFLAIACVSIWILARDAWERLNENDPRKMLGADIWSAVYSHSRAIMARRRVTP